MVRKKTYYLSEMNLSEKHGGGLTLHRVLGEDLDRFDHFIQLFDPKQFPTSGLYVNKEMNIWKKFPEFVWKEMPQRFSVEYIVNYLKRSLGMPNPKYLDYDYKNIHFPKILESSINFDESRFLIVPQHHQSVLLTNILSARHNMEYAAWIMDDHVLRYTKEKGFHYPAPLYYEKKFRTFLKNAKTIFVISDNMKRFYKERFGVDSHVLFGPSDVEERKIAEHHHGGDIRLCYFGAVWKWQEDALDKLASALGSLNATLDIYTFHQVKEEVRSNARIKIKEPVRAEEVKELMGGYDGVAILYGFSDEVRALSELNISTKLSECLASCVPTVLVGPEYGAMTQFGRKYQCCVILSDLNDAGQINDFKNAFAPGRRGELLEKAQQVAENITSTAAMRKVWREGWSKLN